MEQKDVNLEELVDMLAKRTREHIQRAVADLESQFSVALQDVLAATEVRNGGAASSAANHDVKEMREATIPSLERRISRHADHLAALETRLKRVERGE